MTEGNSTITLHNESLDTICTVLRSMARMSEMFDLDYDPKRLRTIANTIEVQ